MMPKKQAIGAGLIVAVWVSFVAAGFDLWEVYEATPGEVGTSGASPATRDARRTGWELVVFVHPQCPCTRATLGELSELARDAGPKLAIRIVFVRPAGVPEGWEHGALWDAATALPGVEVECDAGGAEARRAGAATSGYAVLYDQEGQPVFHGGITRARGRVGESAGRRAILALTAGGESDVRQAPVFGCPLFGPDDCNDANREGAACRQ